MERSCVVGPQGRSLQVVKGFICKSHVNILVPSVRIYSSLGVFMWTCWNELLGQLSTEEHLDSRTQLWVNHKLV